MSEHEKVDAIGQSGPENQYSTMTSSSTTCLKWERADSLKQRPGKFFLQQTKLIQKAERAEGEKMSIPTQLLYVTFFHAQIVVADLLHWKNPK